MEKTTKSPATGALLKHTLKELRFSLRDRIVDRAYRKRLKNTNFTIISNDCTAGCMCKDLKVRMNSPTRNFYFNADDYIKFCQNLEYYLSLLPEIYQGGYNGYGKEFLMASLGDLKLFLVHYHSVEQCAEEWERRRERVNRDNLIFLMNDRNFCTEEHIKAFDELPFEHKVCLTHIRYPQYKSALYIPGSENDSCLKPLMDYVHPWYVERYYDRFDFVAWLNGDKN